MASSFAVAKFSNIILRTSNKIKIAGPTIQDCLKVDSSLKQNNNMLSDLFDNKLQIESSSKSTLSSSPSCPCLPTTTAYYNLIAPWPYASCPFSQPVASQLMATTIATDPKFDSKNTKTETETHTKCNDSIQYNKVIPKFLPCCPCPAVKQSCSSSNLPRQILCPMCHRQIEHDDAQKIINSLISPNTIHKDTINEAATAKTETNNNFTQAAIIKPVTTERDQYNKVRPIPPLRLINDLPGLNSPTSTCPMCNRTIEHDHSKKMVINLIQPILGQYENNMKDNERDSAPVESDALVEKQQYNKNTEKLTLSNASSTKKSYSANSRSPEYSSYCIPCPMCHGHGHVENSSVESMANNVISLTADHIKSLGAAGKVKNNEDAAMPISSISKQKIEYNKVMSKYSQHPCRANTDLSFPVQPNPSSSSPSNQHTRDDSTGKILSNIIKIIANKAKLMNRAAVTKTEQEKRENESVEIKENSNVVPEEEKTDYNKVIPRYPESDNILKVSTNQRARVPRTRSIYVQRSVNAQVQRGRTTRSRTQRATRN